MFEYLPELMKGLHTSLTLTVASLIVALILSLIFMIILTLKCWCWCGWCGVISRCLPVRCCWWRSS